MNKRSMSCHLIDLFTRAGAKKLGLFVNVSSKVYPVDKDYAFFKICFQDYPCLADSNPVVSFPIAFHLFDINVFIFTMQIIDEFPYQGKDSIIRDPFLLDEILRLLAKLNLPHAAIPAIRVFFLFALMVFYRSLLFLFVPHQKCTAL